MNDRMSCGELVEAAFSHRETGQIPLWGTINNRAVYEHILGSERVGDPESVGLDDKLEMHAEVYRKLGIDITRAQIWPLARAETGGSGTTWDERKLTAAGIGEHEPVFPGDSERDEESEVRRRQVRINSAHTVFAPTLRGCFCPTFEKMGLEEFSYAVADSPLEVERVMDRYTEYSRSMAERYAGYPEVPVMAVCDDLAYKTGTIFPPEWMREHWVHRLARIIEPLKEKGKRVVFHSDGRMEALIPDLIGIGIDGINPLEPLAGMDLGKLKREYGKDVTLIGGVDCSQLLPFGTPQEIRDEVRRIIETGAPGGGFIIGDSSCILPVTPVENVFAFYDTVHEYGA
ncbi:MAG: hypothetical protein JW909_02125 [Planctomycetes bacterium]|nr:hypothetical protein [Planctomycetota bacterium]